MFKQKTIEAAKAHAKSEYPKESVGLIAGGAYRPLKNISKTPGECFQVSAEDMMKCNKRGGIETLIHSHPFRHDAKPADHMRLYPSEADMSQQIAMAVPWGIMVCDAEDCTDPIWFGDQLPRPPLLKRPFRHGVTDCYALIRDYYLGVLGLWLRDFPREWNWWNENSAAAQQHLYERGFAAAGFQHIAAAEVKPGDVFLAKIGRAEAVNHGGVYLGGSGDIILHHLAGNKPVDFSRPAVQEPGARYLKYATHWLRYEGDGNG